MPETVTKEYISGHVRQVNEEERTAEFVISDNSMDRHGTRLNMDNFDLTNFRKNPIVLYQHQGYGGPDSDPDDVIGTAEVSMEETSSGKKLIGKVKFEKAEDNPKADKIFRKVLNGTLRATSVGFMPLEDESGQIGQFEEDGEAFQFNGQELLEFSIVNIPSNPNAIKKHFGGAVTRINDYPEKAVENAQRALEIRDGDNPEIQECGTRVGWARANQLAKRENLSEETVARMASFRRHQGNVEGDPTKECGPLMWLAWGGEAGVAWAESKMDELDEKTFPFKQKAEPGDLNEGDHVAWNTSGGFAKGRVDQIQTEGQIDVPDSEFTINASEEDPAALITVFDELEDGTYTPTDTQVGHRFSALEKIDPLPISENSNAGKGLSEDTERLLLQMKLRERELELENLNNQNE